MVSRHAHTGKSPLSDVPTKQHAARSRNEQASRGHQPSNRRSRRRVALSLAVASTVAQRQWYSVCAMMHRVFPTNTPHNSSSSSECGYAPVEARRRRISGVVFELQRPDVLWPACPPFSPFLGLDCVRQFLAAHVVGGSEWR